MNDRIYDSLPFEIALVLQTVERWHSNECQGLEACAEEDLTLLAEAAKSLSEWKERQGKDDRTRLTRIAETQRLFDQRRRFTDKDRPKLRIVPVDEPSGD